MQELKNLSDSSVKRAYQRLNANPHLCPNMLWSAYRGESPRLLRDGLALAAEIGKSTVDLANELKWKPKRIRELLGIDDQRPELTLLK